MSAHNTPRISFDTSLPTSRRSASIAPERKSLDASLKPHTTHTIHDAPPRDKATLLELAGLKVLYFFSGPPVTQIFFLPLIYEKYHNFDSAQIGILSAVPPFLAMLSAPLWAAAADWTGRPRMFMGILPLAGALITWLMLIKEGGFGLAMVAACLSTICINASAPMLDAMCLGILRGERDFYGRQRLWAAVSPGITFMMTNGIMDHVSTPLPIISFSIQTTFALGFVISVGIFSLYVPMPATMLRHQPITDSTSKKIADSEDITIPPPPPDQIAPIRQS
ncbi:hypothetical protein HK097_000512, partial [Rhizophlyctis rosea]